MRKQLEGKLEEIQHVIESSFTMERELGVLGGRSGMALFQFYYAKYLNLNRSAQIGEDILVSCIEEINDGYDYPTFCSGIAGVGWVVDHLEQQGFVEVGADDLLHDLDPFLYNAMAMDMKNGKYDYLHGGIGYAFYFFNRWVNTKSPELRQYYNHILFECITLLKELSEKEGEGKLKWLSVIDQKSKQKGYDLSMSHGMASIAGFLTRLYQYPDFSQVAEGLLKKTINYIHAHQSGSDKAFSLYPNWVSSSGEVNAVSRLAWCYGDLGVALTLWNASKALSDSTLAARAVAVMHHAARRTDPKDSLVQDAGVCHGAFGNGHIFSYMFQQTGDYTFQKAAEFWMAEGLNMAFHKDGHAGYKQWKGPNNAWANQMGLLEGVAGIGLAMIDYLTGAKPNWDQCLMIS